MRKAKKGEWIKIYFVSKNSRFSGIDGGFYFKENIIERDLDILEISNGFAKKIN